MPRNVVFVAPYPSYTTMRFVRAAAKLADVKLLGVVQAAPQGGDAGIYADMVHVGDAHRTEDLVAAVEVLRARHGEPFRIVGLLEAMMVQLAETRAHFGVPGTDVKTTTLFREKAQMKDALRAAGLPVARHKLLHSAEDARAFAAEVGFPMILKPPAGLGARSTFRVATPEGLVGALAEMRVSTERPMLAEEMLRGKEHSFETITVDGEPRACSFGSYLPGCLEVLENPWIQWTCMLPREIDTPVFERARQMGFEAIRVLGLRDGMTHMEWFEREDGSLAIGEIAQRPPGPQLCQMTGLVHDVDIYRAWARAVVDGAFDAPWERRHAAATLFVRGMGRGRVAAVTGVRESHDAVGSWLVEAKLPTLGAPKGESYEGDGYVVVRHESTDKVHEMVATLMKTLKVHYAEA
jgi:D-alanine-D-alanine ligase-like ATP-grasp enzyme